MSREPTKVLWMHPQRPWVEEQVLYANDTDERLSQSEQERRLCFIGGIRGDDLGVIFCWRRNDALLSLEGMSA